MYSCLHCEGPLSSQKKQNHSRLNGCPACRAAFEKPSWWADSQPTLEAPVDEEPRGNYLYLYRWMNLHKIGVTTDPQGRKYALDTANPVGEGEFLLVLEVEDSRNIEQSFLRLFAPRRLNGEWLYLLDIEPQVIAIIRAVVHIRQMALPENLEATIGTLLSEAVRQLRNAAS